MPKMSHHGFWIRRIAGWSGGKFNTLSSWSTTNSTIYMSGVNGSTIGGAQTPSPNVVSGVAHVGPTTLQHQLSSSTVSIPGGPSDSRSLIFSISSSVGDINSTAYGPYTVTQDAAGISAGQKVDFWYNASGTNGNGWIFIAYLINTSTNNRIILSTKDSTASSGWTLSSTTINTSGNYKFVFISGSYDATGDKKIGAEIQIAGLSIK